MALFALLKRQAETYCWLIYCERKTVFLRGKSTAHIREINGQEHLQRNFQIVIHRIKRTKEGTLFDNMLDLKGWVE